MPTISLRTVYQTLNDLSEMGEILHLDLGTGSARFDANVEEPHHHLVCEGCGLVRDLAAASDVGHVPGQPAPGVPGVGHRRSSCAGGAPPAPTRAPTQPDAPTRTVPPAGPDGHPTIPKQPPRKGINMPTLQGSKTEDNLKEAFAGESQANRRYLYFAQKADVEGYPDVAALFRSVAEGETGHAFGHFDFLAEVGDPATGEPVGPTEDNLKSAIAGETYEYTEMYPGFAKTARDEGFEEVAEWLETLARAEKSHAGRFAEGLANVS